MFLSNCLRALPARRALLFLCARSGGGSKAFSLVGLGGASFLAPLDLPVLIPRVKNGLPADVCAQASSDRLRRLASLGPYLRVRPMGESSLRTASGSAVHFGTRAALCERQPLQMPINAVAARGGCVCAPCRPSAAISAFGASHGGEAADEERGTSSVNHDCRRNCRALLARAIRYQPVLLSL